MSLSKPCDLFRAVNREALAAAVVLALLTAPAFGADEEKPAPPPPGLPAGLDWTFNLDATFGTFGFAHSLYTNPKPDEPSGNLSDNWFEGSVKPALSAAFTLANASQLYGKISAVGERTYGSAPSLVGSEESSFDVEDLSIGWRSGTSLGDLGENALDFTVGRTQYKLGHGMLLWDGSAEGGSRGGYWTNARKAFDFAAIARFKPGHHTIEAFYLNKDDLPENETGSKLWGVNYQYAIGEDTTLGATYMKWSAKEDVKPERDGLDVYNLRAYTAPFPSLKALSFELEYAKEDNGDLLDSTAWNAQVAWQFAGSWTPKLSYRYAFFEGDDPATAKNEAFDGLFTGFYDWGAWWQGEIAGEYFISNSNMISHQIRVHVKPNESLSTGLIFFDFRLDHPESAGPGVTSDAVADELDWYADWSVNKNFILSFVAAIADPGAAVEQISGRTDTFIYGMFFVAYSF
ncbi:MAG TPA: alginate export family protein [Steroidobacteraceae bacterium]|nr:alginate export family protein [Steroidobacteraceae bacterium]